MSEVWVVFPTHPLSWVNALVQVTSHTAVCTDSKASKSLVCNDRMSYIYWELLLMVHSVSQTLKPHRLEKGADSGLLPLRSVV